MPVDELRQEPMMAHLMDSLDAGEDIGHYGRLVFAMIARHFLDENEVLEYLKKNPEFGEEQALGLLRQIEARGYNPPKRERILDWMRRQEFPICPEPENATQCNVYRNLDFPQEVYEKISSFYERGEGKN
jgi:DNA primase large subunit